MSECVLMFRTGLWIAAAACFLYFVGMLVVAKWHQLLVGTITLLWFRLLAWVAFCGFVVAVVAEVTEALRQYLFWRH